MIIILVLARPMELKEDVLQCTTAELSYGLCCFITELKRPNGEPYSPDSLFYLCLGIQQVRHFSNSHTYITGCVLDTGRAVTELVSLSTNLPVNFTIKSALWRFGMTFFFLTTVSFCCTLFICGGPCHLSSFKPCSGTLFSSESSLFIQL